MKNYIYNLTENTTSLLNYMTNNHFNDDIIIGSFEKQVFQDNEMTIKVNNSVRGSRVFLLASAISSNDIMALLLAIDAVKRSGAKEIIPVLPYFPYARADKRDSPRSPIGGKVIASMIENAGATSVIAFELHAAQIEGFFNIPLIHIEGKDLFYELFGSVFKTDNVMLCAPDAGAGKRVEHLIDNINASNNVDLPYVLIHKTRKSANVVGKMVLIGDVTDKNVFIYDDMGDTCGTVIKAASVLMEHGAKSVTAMLSHGLFSGDAIEKIHNSEIAHVCISDSLGFKSEKRITTFSCGELISAAMYSIINETSYENVLKEKLNGEIKV